MWRVLSGALSVADRLASRGLRLDPRCQFCGPVPENGFDRDYVFTNFSYNLKMGKNHLVPKEIRS